MAKIKSTAFAPSVSKKAAVKGGQQVPSNDYIRTSIILHRLENGGADEKAVAQLYDFLAENHLAIIDGSSREETMRTRIVNVGATLQDYRNAGIDPGDLRWVQKDGRSHRVRTGALKLPTSLQSAILSWTGFDTQPAARPHLRIFHETPKGRTAATAKAATREASFEVRNLAKLYDFPIATLTGKGQSIAIIELNDIDSRTHQPVGTGFTAADLTKYFKGIKVKLPTVIPVGVAGGANVPGHDENADGEVALDIEVAGAVAPESNIVVYFAPNTDRGFISAIHAAVFDKVHKPSVISISWGGPEDFGSHQYVQALASVLKDASAHNITVFVASGDSGSADTDGGDGQLHVDLPSSVPDAVSTGGLNTLSDLTETVWNKGPRGGGGGGGVSNLFPKPAFQSGVTVPKSPKGVVGRGVPDVSGAADPATGYKVVVGGRKLTIGGTSAVAPLYAGLFALINQSRSAAGKPPAGNINPVIYAAPDAFRDIVHGNNDIFNDGGKYPAGPGWDPASGLGSPIGSKLLSLFQ